MPIDFNNIQTTSKRQYDADNIAKINAALWYLPAKQRAGIIGSIIEESGGNPLAKSKNGTYQGLLQWGADRYKIQSNDPNIELINQINYLKKSLNNTSDHKSWTDGGKGSGYKSYKDTYNVFNSSVSNLGDNFRALSYGYVRPQGKEKSFDNRFKVVKQVYDRIKDADLTNINQLAQPDATRVARPVVVMPIHKREDGGSLGSTLPEVNILAKYPHEQRVIDTMNASNAEFMRRLRNNDTRMMYTPTGYPSTHIITTEDNYVFPLIQDRYGHLEDIRQYVPKNEWLANSIENNDAIRFQTKGDARYFGEHYKKYFPNFFSNFGDYKHTFEDGGDTSSNEEKRKGRMSPKRAPLVKRFWETDEEFKERTKGITQEEIAKYNKELAKEYADMSKHTAEERAQALAEAKKNGTYPKSTIIEELGEASRKMHQSAEKSHSFNRLRRVTTGLENGVKKQVATAKDVAESAQNYANEQAEKKQQQMRDIKKGFDAAATLGEWGAAGYTIGRLTVPRLLSNNTGVMGRVADFFTNSNAQLGVNTIGSLADGYQLLTADNKFDKYENGIELGGDTAGIIGGLDVVRNSNIFGRYSRPIDTALDATGLSAATWDILKNIPPFKYYYGELKDYVNGTNETEDDNQYAEGGEMNAPKHWKELSMADKSDAIAAAVRNGVTTLEDIRKAWDDYADSSYREDRGYREDSSYRGYRNNRGYGDNSGDIEDIGNTLDGYDGTYQEEAHEYLKGGYKPSAAIKNRIANWEGSSMQTNRSFEAEAKDFWNAIPSNVRNKLTQQQADALYSYSYNVGAGNFKRRVVPSLERYFNGDGSVDDVQRHMYATQDSKLRGLAKRRAVERAMFAGQKVEDVPAFNYDYTAKSTSYSPINFSINNNVQTVGYLGPVINNNANRTKQLMSVFDEEPNQQVIVDDTPEPAYNTLERLQNMYSMLGMDDYAQEIGNYNPFQGLMFAGGGKKATVYKTTDGNYTTANGHPVEQIGWDNNGYARYRDTVTGDLGKAYEPSEAYTKRLVDLSELGKGEKPLGLVYPEFDLIGTGGVVKGLTELAAAYAKKKAAQAVVKKSAEKPFTSELDWTPENWFGTRLTGGYDAEDVAALKAHIPEYHAIEEETKRNGTWLKMPDGSTWEGDPRSWVQLQSKDGQKLVQDILYHGDRYGDSENYLGELWGSSSPKIANTYSENTYQLTYPKGLKIKQVDAKGNRWGNIFKDDSYDTNDFVHENLYDKPKSDVVIIKNVLDPGAHKPRNMSTQEYFSLLNQPYNDTVLGPGVPRKSLLGNNGNFDFSNPNIYKGLLPFGLITPAYFQNK